MNGRAAKNTAEETRSGKINKSSQSTGITLEQAPGQALWREYSIMGHANQTKPLYPVTTCFEGTQRSFSNNVQCPRMLIVMEDVHPAPLS